MQQFELKPLERFAGRSAAIRRPQEIAYFSYDEEHQFRLDDSSLKYYYTPSLGADLTAGIESFRKFDDSRDEHLDALLWTIMAKEKETGEQIRPDFITFRGMITKLMIVLYDNFKEPFEMNATLFQDTIFIEEHMAFRIQQRKERENLKWRLRKAWRPLTEEQLVFTGYKFETLSLIPDIWDNVSRDQIEARDKEIVSNYAQYCSVVRTGIGNSTIVIGGEVDAVWDRKPDTQGEPINWVELKTTQNFKPDHADFQKHSEGYERKKLRFWAQSFLLGVPKVVVGFRSQYGILERLEELDVQQIPSSVKKGYNSWDGNACINGAAAILDFIKATIKADGEGGIWRIRRKRNAMNIELFKVEPEGHADILPPAFLEWRLRGCQQAPAAAAATAAAPAEQHQQHQQQEAGSSPAAASPLLDPSSGL